jgi:hypothetical protein
VFDSFDSGDFTQLQHREPELDPAGAGWTVVSGTWQIWEAQTSEQSGVFDHAAQDRFAVIDTGVDEYEMDVEVEWDGGRVGVLFGGQASGPEDAGRNGFLFWRDGNRLKLGKLIGGVYFPLNQAPVSWPKGARRTMEVAVEDGEARLSLNGQAVFEFSDPDLAFATWAGIFQRGRNDERFENFTITMPEGVEPPDLSAPLDIAAMDDLEVSVGETAHVPVTLTGPADPVPTVSATALPHPGGAVAVSDTFSGDGPEVALPGAVWRLVRAGHGPTIASGALELPSGGDGGDQRFVINTRYTDVTVSAEASAPSGRFGLVARHDGSADDLNWVMGWMDIGAQRLLIGRRLNGEFQLLAIRPFAWAADETHQMSLTVRGSQVELAVDGDVKLTASGSVLPSGAHAGVFFGHSLDAAQFDDFQVAVHGLPAFMSLEPALGGDYELVISPLAHDYGEYSVTVNAAAGGEPASENLILTVPQPVDDTLEVPLGSLFLRGDAATDGDRLALTTDELWQGGAAWVVTPQQVAGGFTAAFTFALGLGSGTVGADGLAFVVQRSPVGVEAIGLPGAGLGYELIENSLAVEFDTWPNAEGGEGGAHIAVHSGGTGPNGPSAAERIAFSEFPAISANTVHTMRIVYEPGLMLVYLDDLVTPALEVALDLSALLDLPGGEAFIGFTAASGGVSQSHSVLSFHFKPAD